MQLYKHDTWQENSKRVNSARIIREINVRIGELEDALEQNRDHSPALDRLNGYLDGLRDSGAVTDKSLSIAGSKIVRALRAARTAHDSQDTLAHQK